MSIVNNTTRVTRVLDSACPEIVDCSASVGSSRSSQRRLVRKRRRAELIPKAPRRYFKPYAIANNSNRDRYWDEFLRSHSLKYRSMALEYELRAADSDALYDHLSRYYKERRVCSGLRGTVESEIADFFLDNLLPHDFSVPPVSLLDVRVKEKAGPGLFYNDCGYRSKREADSAVLHDCVEAIRALSCGVRVHPRPYKASGRARLSSVTKEVTKRGRMVQAQDARDLRVGQTISQPVTDAVGASGGGVFGIGTSHFHGEPRVTVRRYYGCVEAWAFDISGMDVSLKPESYTSVTLLRVLRCSSGSAGVKRFIRDTINYREVVMPDGASYLVDTGLASGHCMTSLIETVEVVRLVYAAFSHVLMSQGLGPLVSVKLLEGLVVEVLGDDGRLGITGALRSFVDFAAFSKAFELLFAGDMREEKCEVRQYPSGFSRGCVLPAFLGKEYWWREDGSVWVRRPFEESLSIAFWPERGASSPQHSWDIACGLLIDNPCCYEWQSLVRKYLAWLEDEYECGPGDEWDPWVRQFVFGAWDDDGDPPVHGNTRVLTVDELWRLYDLVEAGA